MLRPLRALASLLRCVILFAFAAYPLDMDGQKQHLFAGQLVLVALLDVLVDLAGAGE